VVQKVSRSFTDHKPLETIFKRDLSILKMILQLKKYDISVTWQPGKFMYIPDTLSRAFLQDTCVEVEESIEVEVHLLAENLPMYELLKTETKEDDTLEVLYRYITTSWPAFKNLPTDIKPYWNFKEDLFVHDGVIYKCDRIVIPKSMRESILSLLHESHMGIEKTRSRARMVVNWPNLNLDIENLVKRCAKCQEFGPRNVQEPMKPHKRPSHVWTKVGCDLFDFGGSKWLVIICYTSNWFEMVKLGKFSTAAVVIAKMKSICARFGIWKELVSDNRPPFQSHDFKMFANDFDFLHTTSSVKWFGGESGQNCQGHFAQK
jgi:hypothetical protein